VCIFAADHLQTKEKEMHSAKITAPEVSIAWQRLKTMLPFLFMLVSVDIMNDPYGGYTFATSVSLSLKRASF
jgi:hypothetical protein